MIYQRNERIAANGIRQDAISVRDVSIKIRAVRKWSENFPARACRDLSFAKAVVPAAKKGHRQGQRKSATEGGKVGEPPYEP